jgi:precorrin-8X/cobalt-precorrin-8 methylmutase
VSRNAGEPKDAAQVRTVARFFAERDRAGELAPMFVGDQALTREQRECVEAEEAWTLGVTGRARRAVAAQNVIASYLRDPAEIAQRSFALIRAEFDLGRFPRSLQLLALRLAHAVGDTAILGDLAWSRGAVRAGREALAAGAPILVDARMVAAGIVRERLSAGNNVICTLPDAVERKGMTRSAAAVELWSKHLGGAVVAIGNAPTALFRLLEIMAEGAPQPALVLGFPVGFVGAAEAKAALAAFGRGIAYITLNGRRGGSALAAAAVNALASAE